MGPRSAHGAACAPWSRPSDTPHRVPVAQKLGRDPALVAAHQIGGEKPLGQLGSRPVKHRSSSHRFLPVADRTFVHPRTPLQPPRLASTAPGTSKSAGPAEPRQMFDTLLLGAK